MAAPYWTVTLPLYARAPFNHSVNEQQKDKADLLKEAHSAFHVSSTGAGTGTASNKIHLPTELWQMILDVSHCVDTCQTHLVFKKANVYNRDTYYIFSGTLREFQHAADTLYSDYLAHSDRNEGDDLPWDSECSGACQGINCPMERGAVCSSLWKTMEFATEKELRLYESLIPSQYSYWGFYEVINMKPLAGGSHMCYGGLSIGDTHESITGQPPSKGLERTCALATCEEVFYDSDKHYFDDESQRHFCSNACWVEA